MTALTIVLTIYIVATFGCAFVGRRMLARDPNSETGHRLVGFGSDLRALGSSPVTILLPAQARNYLEVIDDEDTKPGTHSEAQ